MNRLREIYGENQAKIKTVGKLYTFTCHGRLDEEVGLRSEEMVVFADNALDGAKKEKTDHGKQ